MGHCNLRQRKTIESETLEMGMVKIFKEKSLYILGIYRTPARHLSEALLSSATTIAIHFFNGQDQSGTVPRDFLSL